MNDRDTTATRPRHSNTGALSSKRHPGILRLEAGHYLEMSTYNVTKAGVLALSETLAAELAGTGVNVTALCPTVVPTNIVQDGKLPEKRREFARSAMTRLALTTADKVARQTLDALDRGELYMLPQIDGRMAWRFKRLMPRLYTRIVGETYHLLAD